MADATSGHYLTMTTKIYTTGAVNGPIATIPQLRAVSASLDGHRAEIDGIRFPVRFEINPGDLYGGKADVAVYQDGTPVVVDRAEWDDAHPGIDPTVAAMASVFNDAAFDLSEQARGGM